AAERAAAVRDAGDAARRRPHAAGERSVQRRRGAAALAGEAPRGGNRARRRGLIGQASLASPSQCQSCFAGGGAGVGGFVVVCRVVVGLTLVLGTKSSRFGAAAGLVADDFAVPCFGV